MFESWGRRVYAWRWHTLVASALFLLASAAVLARGGTLTNGLIQGIEAERGATLISTERRSADGSGFTLIFHSDRWTTSDEPFAAAVRASVRPLRDDPHVQSVQTPYDPGVSPFAASLLTARDMHHALVQVTLTDAALGDTKGFPALVARVRTPPGFDVSRTGVAAFRSDLDRVLERDLIRAEVFSTPVTLFVLLLVFGSVVAALLPAGVGGLAVASGVAAVLLLSRVVDVAQYALNVVSLIGLGVAIDYSLFIVSRYRDELAHGAAIPDALATAVATAGRAVAFSGLAVAIGLSGLLFFRGSYLASVGIAGTLVVALSVVYALTFLPALLAVLGTRIHHGRLPFRGNGRFGEGVWRSIANAVMRRPVLVLIPTLALLVGIAHPFLHLQVASPDLHVLPADAPSRQGDEVMRRAFPERSATRIAVVVRFPGAPLGTAERIGALYDLSQRLATIPGVDHVESLFVAPFVTREMYQTALMGPRDALPDAFQVGIQQSMGAHIAMLALVTNAGPSSEAARAIVRASRATRTVGDGAVLVTGQTAMDLDAAAYMRAHVPQAALWVVVMTVLVLFLLLGSVVLPFKAVLMNLLSITGSFGAMVWIFQDGHLHRLLGFTPGPLDPSLPIVLFCATFGLSMDYEVLLLTRMQEEFQRSHDNTRAVAEGLERSGRLITSAAAIMVVVFSAFVTTDIVLLKAIGLGMAIAVTLDATLVRILVVPATMRLFGTLNWWAPGPLARFQQRFHGRAGTE